MMRVVRSPDIRLFHVRAADDELRQILSEDERVRAARFRSEDDQRRFIAGRARLRQILAGITGREAPALRFGAGEHGKPFLIDSGVEFNLSHSGHIVLIAVADVPVGVDVERVERRDGIAHVAREAFDCAELAWLDEPPDRWRAFYRLWTVKEAALKAAGTGVASGLRSVSIDPTRLDHATIRGVEWSISEVLIGPEYCAAVATRSISTES